MKYEGLKSLENYLNFALELSNQARPPHRADSELGEGRRRVTPDEYLKDRVEDQIEFYDRKSGINKKWFITLQIITLVASAFVPVFSIFTSLMWARVVVAVLGSATAITTGVVSLCKYREHWIDYRTTAESLKHEKYMFLTKNGLYVGDDAFAILVERVEALVSQENSAWQQKLETHKKEDKKVG